MIALVRYLAADVLRGQRFLAPLLVFLGSLGMLFAYDPGPQLAAFSGSAALIYPIGAWLTVVVATSEDVVRREITVVSAGGWPRVLAAVAVTAVVFGLAFAVVATVWPVVASPRPYSFLQVLAGLGVHSVAALLGVGVGLMFSRPVFDSIGRTVLVVFGVVVMTYPLGRHTPLGWVLDALGDNTVTLPILWAGLIGFGLVAGAVALGARRA
ncbi:hypothetical protein [Lentzea terrae]|uniref:hypothetical protein n=1 Tax=Lentzea terrae TaxID=2200761 RepID=UPI000DD3B5B0|nr:hypothetical protein [Lentzea terrae]